MLEPTDVDYFNDVATCCYGDMLWDDERNEKFKLSLESAILKKKREGKSTHVLDIGTGTGLLSMLAVNLGADSVVACEMFKPVSECAKQIIEKNKLGKKIKVINKHSTDLTVGPDGDLPVKVDILVSEVFDTELIGEGALQTFNHAHAYLLKLDAIVIPSFGTIYCQLASSKSLVRWNKLENWMDGEQSVVHVPQVIADCPGAPSLFDIQMSQLSCEQFNPLTDPFPIFKFDFMTEQSLPLNEFCAVAVKAKSDGKAQIILLWWDLQMDYEGKILLSCAPWWAHPDTLSKKSKGVDRVAIPWRDHWMQAVYFLHKEMPVQTDQTITLRGWHDEFSFWFAGCDCGGAETDVSGCYCASQTSPVCECGLHLLVSRTRLASINDPTRKSIFLRVIKKLVKKNDTFVLFGDFSLLGIVLASMGAKKVYILVEDSSTWTERVYRLFLDRPNSKISMHNRVESIADLIRRHYKGDEKLCLISEPFFTSALLPWENFKFINLKNNLIELISDLFDLNNLVVVPEAAEVKGVCVKFDDLWKLNRALVTCQGFSMEIFDKLVGGAKALVQNRAEPQPLWEYPCIPQTNPFHLFSIDFHTPCTCCGRIEATVPLQSLDGKKEIDGIALWVEYKLDYENTITTGPVENVEIGKYISWNQNERQGVFIFNSPKYISELSDLSCNVLFDVSTCNCQFNFSQ